MRAGLTSKMVVAGAGAFLLTCASARPAVATVHRKEVFLYKTAGACTHEVDETKFKLSKAHDVSKWDVSNDGMPHGSNACGESQYVILCTYSLVGTNYVHNTNAFKRCNSQPAGLDMNTAFTLTAGRAVTLMCQGETKGATKVAVDSGPAGPVCDPILTRKSAESPGTGQGGIRLFYHVIDIEIVP